ncbi:hypothetical protein ACFW3D_17725 [Streptomyces sp. NPDC058864]
MANSVPSVPHAPLSPAPHAAPFTEGALDGEGWGEPSPDGGGELSPGEDVADGRSEGGADCEGRPEDEGRPEGFALGERPGPCVGPGTDSSADTEGEPAPGPSAPGRPVTPPGPAPGITTPPSCHVPPAPPASPATPEEAPFG